MNETCETLVKCLLDEAKREERRIFGSIKQAYVMEYAADVIKEQAEKLEEYETQAAGLEIMLTTAQSAAQTWERRAEEAERDINAMLHAHVDDMHCDQCRKGKQRDACRYYGKDMCPDAEWRGPCEENGDDPTADDEPVRHGR